MFEAGVYARLSTAPVQGASVVRKASASDYIIQVGGVASKKDRNHPLSHYLQLRIFHLPTAKWQPQSIVTNGYFNRAYHAAVTLDDDIFIFGGENVGQRNIHPPLLHFQQAEHEILQVSKGFFGYKTSVIHVESDIAVEQLGLVGHSATVLVNEGKKYVVIYGGFYPQISGKHKFNTNIFIFSIEDAADYFAVKHAASGAVGENPHTAKPGETVFVLRQLEMDPAHSAPSPRAFHSATVLPPTTASDTHSSTSRIFIHGGRGEHEGDIHDDGWILDVSEYLSFVHNEEMARKKAAEQPVAAAPAPTGKDAKKDAKKDNKKDAAAVPVKPAFPFVQWKAVHYEEEPVSTHDGGDGSSEEKQATPEGINKKRWDHTLSLWTLPSLSPSNDAHGTTQYRVLVTGGHGSASPTINVLGINELQLVFTLTCDGPSGNFSLRNELPNSYDSYFRLSSMELPALWGSAADMVIPSDVLSRGVGADNSDLSLVVDSEGIAVMVFGGFHVDEDKNGWPSRPGSPTNANPSGINHHLFDLSATIAASKTVTTIISPDLLATASHIQQHPRKTMQLHVAEQDLFDRTYVLISPDDNPNDPSLSVEAVKRLKQRNIAREYLRRIMRGEDPERVKADILEQLRRANMQLAAVAFEHRRLVYPHSGNVYEGQVVPVASLINVAREAGEPEPVFDNEFEGVVPHGTGTMTYAQSGNVYAGDWRYGRAHGDGVFDDASEDIRYTGRFVDDIRQGQGHTIDRNQGKEPRWEHRGLYENNTFDGPGEFTDIGQGLRYVGPFQRGLKHGYGKVVLVSDPNQLVCEGKWVQDVMVGEGMAYALPIVSLNVIKGHLPNSLVLNTFFELSIASALRPPPWLAVKEDRKTLLIAGDYAGKLFDGKPNDEFGTATYSDGSIGRGSWKLGRRNGPGVYVFGPDRTQYEGKWVGDRRCGYGTWRTPTNRIIYDGLWSENVYHGTGRLIDYDVDVVYEGQFRLGFKEGQGLVRARATDDEEVARMVDNKTRTLAGAPTSPIEVLNQSQWIHDHTVLLPNDQDRAKTGGGVGREGSMAESYASASYPPSPGDGYGSPQSRSAFNSPAQSRSAKR